MNKYKAQASQEGLVVFIIVLVILSAFLIISNSNVLEVDRLEDLLEDEIECQKLSNHLRGVFVLGDGSQSSVELNKNATVLGDLIIVGGAICNSCCNFTSLGSTSFSINTSIVTVSNIHGNIVLESEGQQQGGQTQNTTIFFDGFENWGSGHCMHNGLWSSCNRGDGHLESHPHDYYNGTRALELDSHNADIDYLIKCVDLTTYTKAYTNFWWKKGGLDSGEYGKLDINTTTTGFVEIFSSGSGSSSYANKQIDITSYISSNTCLKFHALANGNSDNFFVDDFRIIGES